MSHSLIIAIIINTIITIFIHSLYQFVVERCIVIDAIPVSWLLSHGTNERQSSLWAKRELDKVSMRGSLVGLGNCLIDRS